MRSSARQTGHPSLALRSRDRLGDLVPVGEALPADGPAAGGDQVLRLDRAVVARVFAHEDGFDGGGIVVAASQLAGVAALWAPVALHAPRRAFAVAVAHDDHVNFLSVRPAFQSDAPGRRSRARPSWREAYAAQLPADLLANLDEESRAARWTEIIYDNVTEVWVAELDGEIVGWATASDGRDEDAPAPRELEGTYTLRRVYGTGIGQQLHDAAIGQNSACLWMLDENPRAEAFYIRNGFSRDGVERDGKMGGHAVHIVRLVRR